MTEEQHYATVALFDLSCCNPTQPHVRTQTWAADTERQASGTASMVLVAYVRSRSTQRLTLTQP